MSHKRCRTRKDNKRVARCGDRSSWYCWHHRYDDPICKKCTLYIYKDSKNKIFELDGVRVIKCKNCGEIKPLTEYYLCKKIKFDKFGNPVHYVSYIYRCRECTYAAIRESERRKKLREEGKL